MDDSMFQNKLANGHAAYSWTAIPYEGSSRESEYENTIIELKLNRLHTEFSKGFKNLDFIRYNEELNTCTFKAEAEDGKKSIIKTLLFPPTISTAEEEREMEKFSLETDITEMMGRFLHGEGIVKMISSGKKEIYLPDMQGMTLKEIPYFITEYCAGGDLEQIAVQEFPLKEKIRIFAQISHAVSFMHEHYCIVHRDLKPSNILLTENKNPLIIDFDSVEVIGRKNRWQEIGTKPYCSPLQAWSMVALEKHNKNPGTLILPPHTYRTDMYALTLVMAQTIFHGRADNPVEAINNNYYHAHEYYEYIASDPRITFPKTGNEKLDNILAKGIANKRKNRFHSMKKMTSALWDAYESA